MTKVEFLDRIGEVLKEYCSTSNPAYENIHIIIKVPRINSLTVDEGVNCFIDTYLYRNEKEEL